MFELRGVDDRDGARADHVYAIVRVDEGRGILVQPDPDGEGVVGECGQEPAAPVALSVAQPRPVDLGRRTSSRGASRSPRLLDFLARVDVLRVRLSVRVGAEIARYPVEHEPWFGLGFGLLGRAP